MWGYRKNKPSFPGFFNVLKADLAVKHDDNRSKNDYVSVLHTKKPKILPNSGTSGERCPRVKVNPMMKIFVQVFSAMTLISLPQYGSVFYAEESCLVLCPHQA
jgi:hypothetical protein